MRKPAAGRNSRIFSEARRRMPGGVSSPVRGFRAVGGVPRIFVKGRGAHVWDADGNRFIDYVAAWGPLILGHARPEVVAAVRRAAGLGSGFGATHPAEVDLAERVQGAFPSMERVRFVSTGTEAAMSAVRLARAATRRDLVVKFAGCYHGHSDGLLARAGSGVATLGLPDSPGVPRAFSALTLVLPFNNFSAIRDCFKKHGRKIAAVLVEPVAANCGVIPPAAGFLETLRRLTKRHGALLIFDEVVTGFRLAWGGAQGVYGVRPDLTLLGKILGGGYPAAAYGGPARLMEQLAPTGPVYQAGTLSGNPVAMAAGAATLSILHRERPYARLALLAGRLAAGLESIARERGVPLGVECAGSMFTPFFCEGPIRDCEGAQRTDRRLYARFFRGMLARGVSLPPSALEAAFVSAAHTERDLSRTLDAAREVFKGFTAEAPRRREFL